MVGDGIRRMSGDDPFSEIAPYYDRIMDFVNYDRWYMVATALADLLPSGFRHLDAACGTGTLLKRLRRGGWDSVGMDLSLGMLHAGRRGIDAPAPVAVADLRALPVQENVDYVTCLFDSLNFLLDLEDVVRAFREVSGALAPHGLFYFDVVTERMVTEHFEGQEWTENSGRFSTTWRSSYSRKTSVTETLVRITNGAGGVFRERVYEQEAIEGALAGAGLTLLGSFDAQSWKTPGKKTVRIDFVAVKGTTRSLQKQFVKVRDQLRERLR